MKRRMRYPSRCSARPNARNGCLAPDHILRLHHAVEGFLVDESELEARFLPGRFTLWCSLADHRKRGMSATLVVRRA